MREVKDGIHGRRERSGIFRIVGRWRVGAIFHRSIMRLAQLFVGGSVSHVSWAPGSQFFGVGCITRSSSTTRSTTTRVVLGGYRPNQCRQGKAEDDNTQTTNDQVGDLSSPALSPLSGAHRLRLAWSRGAVRFCRIHRHGWIQ